MRVRRLKVVQQESQDIAMPFLDRQTYASSFFGGAQRLNDVHGEIRTYQLLLTPFQRQHQRIRPPQGW
jgi:hypothetical protein